MEYDIVIGIEMHVELNTKTKVFCGCKNEFGGEPNINCCEICTGMPGSLPVINKTAVESTIKAGLATHCHISDKFSFDRKNYFYPDLAKAYQISELYSPICTNGYVEIETEKGDKKRIRIKQIHLEEDAGKLIHTNTGTFVDYNRAGVPLIETVSEPDMSSLTEAINYLYTLKAIYKYIGISDCKMEQGSLRCDINISLKPKGDSVLGKRTEMKNLNSFSAIERAIKYEVTRQRNILDSGKTITQETLRWDDERGINYSMRSKEDAHDYRYFPEPDIPVITVTEKDIQRLRSTLPMLPGEYEELLKTEYKIRDYDAKQLTKSIVFVEFFLKAVKVYNNAQAVSNWILSEIFKRLNTELADEVNIPLNPKNFAKLVEKYIKGEISQASARTVLDELWKKDEEIDDIVARLGLTQLSDEAELEEIIKNIIEANPNAVADYKKGNTKTIVFFVGQTMKATSGKANAGKVNDIVKKLLS